jgi:hypothetical protein
MGIVTFRVRGLKRGGDAEPASRHLEVDEAFCIIDGKGHLHS